MSRSCWRIYAETQDELSEWVRVRDEVIPTPPRQLGHCSEDFAPAIIQRLEVLERSARDVPRGGRLLRHDDMVAGASYTILDQSSSQAALPCGDPVVGSTSGMVDDAELLEQVTKMIMINRETPDQGWYGLRRINRS